jgi:prophage tail gpP-like protein
MPDVDPERSPFGYKTGWVAVRSESADHVAASLGLVDCREASWQEGVAAAYSKGVFVCPSVDGRILAMGEGVIAGGVDAAALSARIGSEVQVFKTHRVVDLHAWARAEEGVLTRDFEFLGESGEIVKNVGLVTPAEEDEASAADCASLSMGPVPFDDEGLDFPAEDTVMAIAAAWSLDPTSLGGPDDRLGVLGRLR